MKCSEPGCSERATYAAPNLAASRDLLFYVVDYFCDYHGPLPYIKMLPEENPDAEI